MNNCKVKNLCSRVPKWVFDPVLPILLMLFAAAVAVWYITGPMLVMFHSDFTDSLIWANVTAQTGDILSPDFNYAAILPFGAPLWMVPILKIFGYGRISFQLSMIVFVVIFMASAYYFFRGLKWNRLSAGAAAACFCLVMSGSDTLLEMLWGHTIYYSLGLLFWLLLMGLALRLMDTARSWKKGKKLSLPTILELAAVAILCAGCATDGFQVLALGVAPVMVSLAACAFFSESPLLGRHNRRTGAVLAVMAAACVAGLAILVVITKGGSIQSRYANGHMVWDRYTDWASNLMTFFPNLSLLFGVEVEANEKLLTLPSVVYALKLVLLMVIFIAPVAMLLRYKKLKESTRMALWGHFTVSAVIFFLYVFGILNTGNWRLIPCLGTGMIVTMLWIRELLGGTRVHKRIAVLLAALMAAVCLLNAVQVARLPRDIRKNPHWKVTQILKEKGYDYGYATFWNSHPVVMLSDDEIQVTTVKQEGTELEARPYQNFKQEFQPREDKDTCFLMLEQQEFENVQKGEYWKRLNESRKLVDSFTCGKFIVLVYDGCVIV